MSDSDEIIRLRDKVHDLSTEMEKVEFLDRKVEKQSADLEEFRKTHYNLKVAVEKLDSRKFCEDHAMAMRENAVNVQIIKDYIAESKAWRAKIDNHVSEGEKEGGARDRLKNVEGKVKSFWRVSIISGVIGGLCASNTPEFFSWLFRIVSGK